MSAWADPHLWLLGGLLVMMLATSVAAITISSLLCQVIILCNFSLLMALLYTVLEAPDVAITEAAVGAGLSTLVFLAAIAAIGNQALPDSRRKHRFSRPAWAFAATLLFGIILGIAVLDLPSFGSASAPAQQYLAPEYLQRAPNQIGIPNIVTAILASYRGFDTLGEVCVVFAALTALILLLPRKEGRNAS